MSATAEEQSVTGVQQDTLWITTSTVAWPTAMLPTVLPALELCAEIASQATPSVRMDWTVPPSAQIYIVLLA